MPAFHWYDLLILAGIALLIFGPKRLPEMGSAVGKTIKEFQKSMREVTGGHDNTAAVPPPATPATKAELSAPSTPSAATTSEGTAKTPETTTP